jgi:hypothetical protein
MSRLSARPIALLASVLLLGTLGVVPGARAATRVVTNCNDAGPGSLRAAAAAANSGDTIDLRALTCNRILLTSGAIVFTGQFITVIGAGESRITIDGNHASRVFEHHGPASAPWPLDNQATLRLVRLTAANGFALDPNGGFAGIGGGCIEAATNVRLEYAQVHHCIARSLDPIGGFAQGGGVFAGNDAILFHAAVFSNRAEGADDNSVGGGLYVFGTLHVSYSAIRDNFVQGEVGGGNGINLFLDRAVIRNNVATGNIGGVAGFNGYVTINKSTISGNLARLSAALAAGGPGPVLISESTISGNRSAFSPAGFSLDGRGGISVLVLNSTIADNIADASFLGNEPIGGVAVFGPVRFRSTIIADNYVGTEAQDLWAQIAFGARVLGDDNLIEVSNAPLPVDTIRADPMLGPLADNGGRAQTQSLSLGSPAIDAGNNAHNYQFDQRGEGFPRVVNGRADIGAYER